MARARPQPPPPRGLDPQARVRLLKAASSYLQPDVWRIDPPGGAPGEIWKSFAARPAWMRATIGRWLTAREASNLEAVRGIRGLPEHLGRPDPWTLRMTLLDADPVPEVKHGGDLDPAFFEDLEALVAAIHARGLNHGDIRRKNLMRRRGDGGPALVDFAQSFNIRRGFRPLVRIVLRTARTIDRQKLLKLKSWYLGRPCLTDEELAELDAPPWHLRLGRFARKGLYKPLKRLLGGRS